MAEFVALPELLKALRSAVSASKSGAFFITSSDQHSAMLTLDKGRVTGVKYRNTRGYDAARAIAAVDQVRFQTGAEPTELPGESGLDTETVLAILEGKAADAGAASGAAPAGADSGEAGGSIDADLDAIRDRYIAAIGPIGGALFDEEYQAMGGGALSRAGYAELIEKLAAQIDDDAEANSFRGDVGL